METTEALNAFAERLGIKKRTGLGPEEQRVADATRLDLASDPHGFIDAYRRIFGLVFNADDAMELFADYAASPESRSRYGTAVHNSARWMRDRAFEQALADPSSPERVIFMSGGSGSGKSTVAPTLATVFPALVYDTTLSVLPGARKYIHAALAEGKHVLIVHIRRSIEVSFKANLDRAISILGAGRVTSIAAMIRTHQGADEVIVALADEFRERPHVTVHAFENEGDCRNDSVTGNPPCQTLAEVMNWAIKKYGSKPEEMVKDFPQYDRRISRVYTPKPE